MPPGDATTDQMNAIADLADRYSFGELRVSHEQNLILADVRQSDLPALWREARELGLATPNIGLLTNIIACPGGDFCSLANAKSIPVAQALQESFEGPRLPVRHRRDRPQHLGLHERLRPPPRRPHRHPRRR